MHYLGFGDDEDVPEPDAVCGSVVVLDTPLSRQDGSWQAAAGPNCGCWAPCIWAGKD